MMRITDSIIFTNFLNQLQDLNRDFARLNEQVTTGKRINRPSDDPTGFSQLTALKGEISRLTQYGDNVQAANRRLESTDGQLNDVTNALTRVIQLTQQAANQTTVGEPRRGIAEELFAVTREILGVSDARVGGKALFAGTRNTTESLQQIAGNIDGSVYSVGGLGVTSNGAGATIGAAINDQAQLTESIYQFRVLDNAGNFEVVNLDGFDAVVASGNFSVVGDSINVDGMTLSLDAGALAQGDAFTIVPRYAYNGTETDIEMQIDDNSTIVQNVEGTQPFGGNQPTGAVQNPGNTLFDDLVELRRAMLTDDQAVIESSIVTVRNRFDQLEEVRANAGGRISNLRNLQARVESELADLVVNAADIENVDLAKAITDLTQSETGRQAALQAGARIGRLSLFNFLG